MLLTCLLVVFASVTSPSFAQPAVLSPADEAWAQTAERPSAIPMTNEQASDPNGQQEREDEVHPPS